MNEAFPRFPAFISLAGKDVLIAGGGAVAARRAGVLLAFGAVLTVASPEISPQMRAVIARAEWRREPYSGMDKPYALVIAATNSREANRRIGEDAKAAGIYVSVADSAEESTFWFPAVARGNGLTAGIISEKKNHGAAKSAVERIRRVLEESK